jgi:hypothetical protein
MTETSPRPPRRYSGNPTFVTAHGIEADTGLPFEHAYVLAKLVVEQGGGPVPCRGTKALISTPARKALVELGLIRVDASSEFAQWAYAELKVDGRLAETLDAKFIHTKLIPLYVTEHTKWAAVATQAAFNLVAKHFPAST